MDNAFWNSEANSNYVSRITMDGGITRLASLWATNDILSGITLSSIGGVYVGHMSVVPYAEGQTFISEILPNGTVCRAWDGLTMVAGLNEDAIGDLITFFHVDRHYRGPSPLPPQRRQDRPPDRSGPLRGDCAGHDAADPGQSRPGWAGSTSRHLGSAPTMVSVSSSRSTSPPATWI